MTEFSQRSETQGEEQGAETGLPTTQQAVELIMHAFPGSEFTEPSDTDHVL